MKNTRFVLIEAEKLTHLLESDRPSLAVNAINQYRCDTCRTFYATELAAEACCNPNCIVCGRKLLVSDMPRTLHGNTCASCMEANTRRHLIDRLRNAERVTAPSTSFVYVPGVNDYLDLSEYEDSPFQLAEIVEEFCLDRANPVPVPAWVWDCDEVHWQGLDIEQYIENELEEWFDDASSQLTGMDALVAAVNAFNAQQNLTQYVYTRRVIILDEAAFAALTKVHF